MVYTSDCYQARKQLVLSNSVVSLFVSLKYISPVCEVTLVIWASMVITMSVAGYIRFKKPH